jgi:ABC-type bacteriocin/lantibiotic exporter with double-glycine peptidase domain
VEVLAAIRTVKSQIRQPGSLELLRRYRRSAGNDYRFTSNRAVLKESGNVVLNSFKILLFLVAAQLVLQGQASVGRSSRCICSPVASPVRC